MRVRRNILFEKYFWGEPENRHGLHDLKQKRALANIFWEGVPQKFWSVLWRVKLVNFTLWFLYEI